VNRQILYECLKLQYSDRTINWVNDHLYSYIPQLTLPLQIECQEKGNPQCSHLWTSAAPSQKILKCRSNHARFFLAASRKPRSFIARGRCPVWCQGHAMEEEHEVTPKYREDTPEFVFLKTIIKLTPAIVLHKKPATPRYGTPYWNRLRHGIPTCCDVSSRGFMYYSILSN